MHSASVAPTSWRWPLVRQHKQQERSRVREVSCRKVFSPVTGTTFDLSNSTGWGPSKDSKYDLVRFFVSTVRFGRILQLLLRLLCLLLLLLLSGLLFLLFLVLPGLALALASVLALAHISPCFKKSVTRRFLFLRGVFHDRGK